DADDAFRHWARTAQGCTGCPCVIKLVVPRTLWATAPRLRAPLFDLDRNHAGGINVLRRRRGEVTACCSTGEVSADHCRQLDRSVLGFERWSGVSKAYDTAVVHRVVQRRARVHEPVYESHRYRDGRATRDVPQ